MNKKIIIQILILATCFTNLFANGIEYGVTVGLGASSIFKTKIPDNTEVLPNFKKGYLETTPEMSALIQLGYFMNINQAQTFSFLADLGFLYENGYSYKVRTYTVENEDKTTTINKYYYGLFGMPSFSGGLLFRYTIYDFAVVLGGGVILAEQELGYAKAIFEYNISALKRATTVLGVYVRSDFAPRYGYNVLSFGLNVGLRFGGRPEVVEEARKHRESMRLTNIAPRN